MKSRQLKWHAKLSELDMYSGVAPPAWPVGWLHLAWNLPHKSYLALHKALAPA